MTKTPAVAVRAAALAAGVGIGGFALSFALGDQIELVRGAVLHAGMWGVGVFVALHVVTCLLPFPRSGFAALAGALYGVAGGILLSVVGSALAAILAFALARRFGPVAAPGRWGFGVDRIERILRSHGVMALIATRLMPIPPFAITNYLAGLSPIRTRSYMVSLVGLLPSSIAWVTVGASVALDGRLLLLAAAFVIVLLLACALWTQRARHTASDAVRTVHTEMSQRREWAAGAKLPPLP